MLERKYQCQSPGCIKQATMRVGGFGLFCLMHARITTFDALFRARTLADYPIVRRIEDVKH